MKELRAELLAPAGSIETMKAVFAAGADAVYMGGPLYGARAFADNPDTEAFLEAIDYAHIRNKKIYMTVNTLLKERELKNQLYEYLLPFYERGLDAVIVQDVGVFDFVKENFPKLPIHISTQMTVTGEYSAEYFKEKGASRVVTARELSLCELERISKTGIEVESFIHGAICYCYSGKCLFSSIAGGRSGNRGRCAQPCRQPYDVYDEAGNKINRAGENYVLSLKDMNTLDILPKIIKSGVYSLKIEGRMKKPEYAAGVVSIYRKYLDILLSGKEYKVKKEDQDRLFDLFNRNGFSTGYYKQKNSREMLSLTESTFRTHDEAFVNSIRDNYIRHELKRKINMYVYIHANESVSVNVYDDNISIEYKADIPEKATGRPLDEDQVRKQLSKLGGSDFELSELTVDLEDGLFIAVSKLNEVRRAALSLFSEEILKEYRRNIIEINELSQTAVVNDDKSYLTCQVQTMEQLEACLDYNNVNRIIINQNIVDNNNLAEVCEQIHSKGKDCYISFSEPIRLEQQEKIKKDKTIYENAGVDGFLCNSFESLMYLKKLYPDKKYISDHGMYTWNNMAINHMLSECDYITAPLELKAPEMINCNHGLSELIVYGYIPMMLSANCIFKTTSGCRKSKMGNLGYIKDKQGRRFPVLSDCNNCSNTIYNCVPLVLFDNIDLISKFNSHRLVFTIENKKDTRYILNSYAEGMYSGEFTRGNIKRGVE